MKILAFILCIFPGLVSGSAQTKPVRIGVAGLTHDHVHGLLGRRDAGDVQIVGIAESNLELAKRYAQRYGFDISLVYPTLEDMVKATHPEAVMAFGNILDHLHVVQVCAPLGIDVMVEKPLAINLGQANEMAAFAQKYKIQLLTNYETTWYATHHRAYDLILKENAFGDIRKIVVHDGHPGPKEIGISKEFLSWLTDPALNGGGAVMDFGCYGADLITWLMKGDKPVSVFAVTQQIKPDVYPKVDDEATIIVTYPKAQGIIQASWNWPYSRKDMEVYGQHGYAFCENRSDLRYRKMESAPEIKEKLDSRPNPYDDPFSYFAAVVRKSIVVSPEDLSSLPINLVAMEILDAAKESARTGKLVKLR